MRTIWKFSVVAVKTVVVDLDAAATADPEAASDRAGSHIVATLTDPGLADVLEVTVAATEEEARRAWDAQSLAVA